jgi:hypothetical protein
MRSDLQVVADGGGVLRFRLHVDTHANGRRMRHVTGAVIKVVWQKKIVQPRFPLFKRHAKRQRIKHTDGAVSIDCRNQELAGAASVVSAPVNLQHIPCKRERCIVA